MSEKGSLYLVSTPIGNLSDFSPRAQDVLANCDIIACEDTRVTQKLLTHFGITKPLISYREENERKQTPNLILEMTSGKKIALVSDAGFPSVSDPGFCLVRQCRREGFNIVPVPGPNAAITALVASGLPTHNFLFLGFPPKGKVAFENLLEKWKDFGGSLIFYQSKYKIPSTFEVLEKAYGKNRYISVARELTKLHESILVGTIVEVKLQSQNLSQKGEFTIIVAPNDFTF